MTIIRIEHSSDYTCISNKAIRDKRLSYKARGLHHLLLSYPNNWTVNIDHLAAESDKDGRAAVMSALNELQEHGYMTMRGVRNEIAGQFIGWEKVVRETPIPQDEAIPAEIRKSNLGGKARKTSTSTEVRKSNVGDTEVRKTSLRINRITDKPQDGKSGHIISTNSNKYLNQGVSTSPLPPSGEKQASATQLELKLSQPEASNSHPLKEQPQQLKLQRQEVAKPHPLDGQQKRSQTLQEQASDRSWGKSSAPAASDENSCSQPIEVAVSHVATEVLPDAEPSGSSQPSNQHQGRTSRDRFNRNQAQLPKNIDGSVSEA